MKDAGIKLERVFKTRQGASFFCILMKEKTAERRSSMNLRNYLTVRNPKMLVDGGEGLVAAGAGG